MASVAVKSKIQKTAIAAATTAAKAGYNNNKQKQTGYQKTERTQTTTNCLEMIKMNSTKIFCKLNNLWRLLSTLTLL